MIYPSFIKENDCIGVPAPSAGADCAERINKSLNAKKTLEKLGYYLDVDESQYLGVTLTPLICHDKYGYKYKVTYDAILRGKKPSPVSKSNEFSIENINTFLKIFIQILY